MRPDRELSYCRIRFFQKEYKKNTYIFFIFISLNAVFLKKKIKNFFFSENILTLHLRGGNNFNYLFFYITVRSTCPKDYLFFIFLLFFLLLFFIVLFFFFVDNSDF